MAVEPQPRDIRRTMSVAADSPSPETAELDRHGHPQEAGLGECVDVLPRERTGSVDLDRIAGNRLGDDLVQQFRIE